MVCSEHGIEIEANRDAVQLPKIEVLPPFDHDGFDRYQELMVPVFAATGTMNSQRTSQLHGDPSSPLTISPS